MPSPRKSRPEPPLALTSALLAEAARQREFARELREDLQDLFDTMNEIFAQIEATRAKHRK